MITDFLTTGAVGILTGILGALPDAGTVLTVPSGMIAGYTFLNTFLPVSELISATLVVLTVYVGVFVVRLLLTIWSAVPFKFS